MFEERYEYVLGKVREKYGPVGEWIANDIRLEEKIRLFQNMEEDFERFREIVFEKVDKNVQFSKICLELFQQEELKILLRIAFPGTEFFFDLSYALHRD